MTPGRAPAADCKLGPDQLAMQLDRYGRLGEHVSGVSRRDREAIVRAAKQPPARLVMNALEVERDCCPFLQADYDPAALRLTLIVQTTHQEPTLHAIVAALTATSGIVGASTHPR